MSVCEYAPASIKKTVAGHGGADKNGVRVVIMRMLGLRVEPREDESDALAAAVCHGLRRPFESRLAAALRDRRSSVRLVRR
jgi:crossover junction endodeoxyribonuclease RuvC